MDTSTTTDSFFQRANKIAKKALFELKKKFLCFFSARSPKELAFFLSLYATVGFNRLKNFCTCSMERFTTGNFVVYQVTEWRTRRVAVGNQIVI